MPAYDELYHHGILGMKWGVRRFQNKDGSLTKAGQKRRVGDSPSKPSSKNKVVTKKLKTNKSKEKTPPQKKISEMSDDELKETISRMQLEKNAYDLQKSISTLNPRKISFGEKFAKSLLYDVVAPAAKNVGKMYLENMLKNNLGLNKKEINDLDSLRKEVNILSLKKTKAGLNKEGYII